ncbi:MAG: WXG100 family type VII secretion target [Anaerolineales bacterium]|nr:WXG100 family type VII secretion target [Anaerolineales bacterium]
MNTIRMDFLLMEETIQSFEKSAESLDNTVYELRTIINVLAGGALLGETGEALIKTLQSNLIPAVQKVQNKLTETATDMKVAVTDMRESDASTNQGFAS